MPLPQHTEVFHVVPRGPRAPGRARALLRGQFTEWDIGTDPTDTAELLLSELVTNAVRHARAPHGRDIGVRLARYDGLVRVEVSDAGPPAPLAPRAADAQDERGRGLAIIAALAVRWGQCPRGAGGGKAVWAEVAERSSGGSVKPGGSGRTS
ncbi:ATP-binding protein [Streptomyces sp. G-G2]|uniref:ATP-binding protein n=1 Tax=Streptomyces sp. G-G2 TaxID=3046201 RepID=UPI0024BB4CF2|nr:ATP-binding protein [Streptomyces sp. G-G2]MDJ0379731.1 ATP-binding protein [Streptomyces sp. G-G2]